MTANTLPSVLQLQTVHQYAKIAIRHKQLGIWHEKNWAEIKQEVLRLAEMLKINGFQQGDILYLLTDPRPEALLISIAAHWLGGVSAPLQISDDETKIISLIQQLKPSYIFAEGQLQVDLVQKSNQQAKLIIYADARGLSRYRHEILKPYSQIFAQEIPIFYEQGIANPNEIAFAFFRLDAADQIEVEYLTHADMLKQGNHLIAQERLTAKEQAFAARTFAASGQMRYLLAPWLLAGFTLNFPENINTRDIDRREIGPTLVAGTAQTYQRLESLIHSRLPTPGSLSRSILDWSLQTKKQSSALRKCLAYYLIIRPLKDVIGFSYTRVPLLVGEPLSVPTANFFASLQINIKHWPNATHWHKTQHIPHSTEKLTIESFNKPKFNLNSNGLESLT